MHVVKILVSVAAIDVVVFPILWVLRVPLLQVYIPVTCFEGGAIILIGILLLLNSLSSEVALVNDRYVGFGAIRRGIRFVEMKGEQKRIMRKRRGLDGDNWCATVYSHSYGYDQCLSRSCVNAMIS